MPVSDRRAARRHDDVLEATVTDARVHVAPAGRAAPSGPPAPAGSADAADLSRANYAAVWDAVAAAVPDRPAVVAQGRTITYREVAALAARLSATLVERGLGVDSKVAVFMYNRLEYLVTIWAAYRIGAIPVNINFRYGATELAELLDVSRPEALVYPSSLRAAVLGAAGRAPVPDLVLVVDDDGAPPAGHTPFAAALEAPPLPPRPVGPEHKIFMFTGGTTGRPKAVVWTHGNLFDSQQFSIYGSLPVDPPRTLEEVVAIAARDDLPRTVCLPLTPMMHATALFNVMNAVVLGGTVVFLSSARLDPLAAVRAIDDHRVTRLIVAGNAVVGPLVDALESPEGAGVDVGSLGTVLSSGMAWSDDLKARLLAHAPHATLIDILGASEGGPFAYGVVRGAQDLPSRLRLAPGAVVLDGEMRDVSGVVGATGVLGYRGAMPLGYHDDPERTAQAYPYVDGVRHVVPGDWVRVLGDGYVEMLGRGSSVVNTGGEKVYPAEVEGVILAMDDVVDAVVLGVPDQRWGEIVAALVVTVPGSTLTADDVRAEVGRHLAGYKKPRHVLLVDRLERSPSGKLEMRTLRARARQMLGLDEVEEAGR